MAKNVIKGSFPISKVLVFEGNSYVFEKHEDIRLFYDCTWQRMWLKALFSISKVLVFGANSYVCGKNENIRLFYDCTL